MESCEMVSRFCRCRVAGRTPPINTRTSAAMHKYMSRTFDWSFMDSGE